MKFTEGGFKKWGYELAEREFGKDIAAVSYTHLDVYKRQADGLPATTFSIKVRSSPPRAAS